MIGPRALGLLLGVAADALTGDPHRGHPVAIFGQAAAKVEEHTYADSRAAGVGHVVATVGPVVALGVAAERLTRSSFWARAAVTALATWAVLGAASLRREAHLMANHLDADDLAAARERVTHLCGRDPNALDPAELARATVESVAENTADAAVASLFWGAIAGVPGLLAHRAVNTLDAMVGSRSPRYENFGWASARLDDLLCLAPARFTGALACTAAPLVGGDARRAWRIMLRDARNHPSPNGGWCESAFAGALGVQLGGTNVYAGRVEERGLLGDGPRPGAEHARKAGTLSAVVVAATAALAVLVRRKR
ncbi:cobalamin biosynthesis protein [Tessaracoccus massiliensis]|uniref:cobalamin biosynthesis protein n=1 Tax=Tessaracoccus massiliensis TaxID=1522311 RepID=UPI00058E59E4|nr:cobalamin biosynthesis protein [Tessaracoccus massiliensis]